MPARDLLKQVTIIFITSTIVWPQVKQQGGNTACPSTENWIKDLLSMVLPIRTRPSFPSVSLSHQEASISILSFSIRGSVSQSVQSLSHVQLFVTPWTAAHQDSLFITNSWSLPKFMSIESVMPSNHLILCRPLLLLPSIFPSIRVFTNESAFRISWPKYWSFSFSISPSNEHPGLISFRMDWLDLLAVPGTLRVFSNTTVQKHQFIGAQLSL